MVGRPPPTDADVRTQALAKVARAFRARHRKRHTCASCSGSPLLASSSASMGSVYIGAALHRALTEGA